MAIMQIPLCFADDSGEPMSVDVQAISMSGIGCIVCLMPGVIVMFSVCF